MRNLIILLLSSFILLITQSSRFNRASLWKSYYFKEYEKLPDIQGYTVKKKVWFFSVTG